MAEISENQERWETGELELGVAQSGLTSAQLEITQMREQGEEREQRIRQVQSMAASAGLELAYLQRSLALAERPLWKKLFRRPV